MRESPALKLMDLLEKRGALVDYNDPYIPELPETRKYKKKKKSVELTPDNLSLYDCVVITTDHSLYDPDFIAKNSKLIIDTRNLIKSKTYQNVLKA